MVQSVQEEKKERKKNFEKKTLKKKTLEKKEKKKRKKTADSHPKPTDFRDEACSKSEKTGLRRDTSRVAVMRLLQMLSFPASHLSNSLNGASEEKHRSNCCTPV